MPWDRSHPCCDDRSRLGRRGSAGTSCDIAQHLRLPCRGRSNSEQPQTSDLGTGNITYFSDGCKSNRTRGISKCTQPDMRLETVGGVTEWARIAMLTSAGRVQRCRAPVMDPVLLPRSSGTYASSTVRRPSRKKVRCRYVGYRRSSNQANDSSMLATGGILCGGRQTVGSGAGFACSQLFEPGQSRAQWVERME